MLSGMIGLAGLFPRHAVLFSPSTTYKALVRGTGEHAEHDGQNGREIIV